MMVWTRLESGNRRREDGPRDAARPLAQTAAVEGVRNPAGEAFEADRPHPGGKNTRDCAGRAITGTGKRAGQGRALSLAGQAAVGPKQPAAGHAVGREDSPENRLHRGALSGKSQGAAKRPRPSGPNARPSGDAERSLAHRYRYGHRRLSPEHSERQA